jgi:hypothetical protein
VAEFESDAASDAALKTAWELWQTTADDVRAAIEATERFQDDPRERGAAYQSLLEAQAMAYNIAVAPRRFMEHPRPFHHSTWHDNLLALGQPIQDFKYSGLFLDGRRTYTARVRRGASKLWLTQVHNKCLGDPESVEIGNYDYDEFEFDADGTADITFSAQEHPGNWIRLDGDSSFNWLVMRRILGDWEDDLGDFEFVSATPAPPVLDPTAEAAESITAAAHLVRYLVSAFTIGLHQLYIGRAGDKNAWATMPGAEVKDSLIGSRSTVYVPAVFQIGADEAVVVEWDVPESAYWSFQVGDIWSRPLDYLHHQTDLNMERATIDPDGKVRIVVALTDPGVPNWIDPCGRTEGTLVMRNYRAATDTTVPDLRVVPLADLASALHPETARCTPEQRTEALARRRRGAARLVAQ